MAYEIVLDAIPPSLVINNSVSWKVSLSDFPATTWTLTYALVNTANQETIVASADGTDHLVEIPVATSAGYTAGEYNYQAFVDDGADERYKVGEGEIEIVTDYEAATSGYDARSWVKKTLDAIEDVITGKVSQDRASYSVHGRSLSSYTWDEILQLYDDFKGKYSAEQQTTNKKSSTVKVWFTKS